MLSKELVPCKSLHSPWAWSAWNALEWMPWLDCGRPAPSCFFQPDAFLFCLGQLENLPWRIMLMGLLFKYEWFLASWASIWFISLSMCFIILGCSQNVLGLHIGLCKLLQLDSFTMCWLKPQMLWWIKGLWDSHLLQLGRFLPSGALKEVLDSPMHLWPMHLKINHYHVTFVCGTPKCGSQINASIPPFFCPISVAIVIPIHMAGWCWMSMLTYWTNGLFALGGVHILSQSHPLAISWICAQKVNPRGFKVQRNAFLILISAVMVCCLSFTNVPRVRKTYHLHNW